MNTKEKIEIMQAYLDGKEIEVRAKGLRNWNVCHTRPEWDWNGCDYRIKKAPEYIVLDACCDKTDFEIVKCVELKALEDALGLINWSNLFDEEDARKYKALKALVKGDL